MDMSTQYPKMCTKTQTFLWILATALFITFCFSRTCQAQTVITFKLLPPGHDGQVQGVGRARYYLLEDYLKLAQFDSELFSARNQLEIWERLVVGQEQELKAKDVVIKTLEDDKKVLGDRALRLDEKWKKCESELVNAAKVPIWGYVVGATGAALAIVGVGLIVGSQAHK